jgi:hypothetical protein
MRGVCLGTLVFLVVGTMEVAGQELTTVSIPSADEVYEALALGDIDYEQYVALLEYVDVVRTMRESVFRSDLPSLDRFSSFGVLSELDQPSSRPSRALETAHRRDSKGFLKYQYYTTFADSPSDRYSTRGDYKLANSWSIGGQVKRDQNGRERFTSRRLAYHADSGFVRELELGNFVESYGLGTIIGSRNKVLKFDGSLSVESFLFPDCGGFNGINVVTKTQTREIAGLVSYNRDTSVEVLTWAAMTRQLSKSWSKSIAVGVNQVLEKRSRIRVIDLKAGLTVTHGVPSNQWAVEYCFQSGRQAALDNVVFEGRVRSERTSVSYSAWHYGSNFVDITSGSKAAPIRHMEELPATEFAYADKRAGQTGFQVRNTSQITPWFNIGGDVLFGTRHHDTAYVQFCPVLRIELTHGWTAKIDYLQTRQSKREDDVRHTSIKGRAEIETRMQTRASDLRIVLAHTTTPTTGDFVSILASYKHDFNSGRQCEVWSNVGQLVQSSIDYWYGYVRTSQPLWENTELSVKVMHRFRRGSTPKHETAANLELTARI